MLCKLFKIFAIDVPLALSKIKSYDPFGLNLVKRLTKSIKVYCDMFHFGAI